MSSSALEEPIKFGQTHKQTLPQVAMFSAGCSPTKTASLLSFFSFFCWIDKHNFITVRANYNLVRKKRYISFQSVTQNLTNPDSELPGCC